MYYGWSHGVFFCSDINDDSLDLVLNLHMCEVTYRVFIQTSSLGTHE